MKRVIWHRTVSIRGGLLSIFSPQISRTYHSVGYHPDFAHLEGFHLKFWPETRKLFLDASLAPKEGALEYDGTGDLLFSAGEPRYHPTSIGDGSPMSPALGCFFF